MLIPRLFILPLVFGLIGTNISYVKVLQLCRAWPAPSKYFSSSMCRGGHQKHCPHTQTLSPLEYGTLLTPHYSDSQKVDLRNVLNVIK